MKNNLHPASFRHSTLVLCVALAWITLALYWPVQYHGFAGLDDDQYVTKNAHVVSGLTLEGLRWAFSFHSEGYWHPLSWLSHMLDCQLYGLNSLGHHWNNLLLHLANTLLLFLLLKRLTGKLWRSTAVALLFSMHPLNVESVAWVASRKNLLSTLFLFLTLLAYTRYSEQPRFSRYLAVFVCLGLGLMAKPMLVTLPVILLLMDYWPLGRLNLFPSDLPIKRSPPSAIARAVVRLALEKLPLLALSIGSIWISIVFSHGNQILVSSESVHLSLRIKNGLTSYFTYLYKAVWPSDLAIFYAYPLSIPDWQWMGAAILLLILTVFIIRKSNRIPFLLFGWAWYLITLLPVIGLVQQGLWPAWADRFAYVPMVGLSLMLFWGIPTLAPARIVQQILFVLFCVVALPILAYSTRTQIGYWSDNEGLLKHAIESTDRNHLSHYNLAHLLLSQGRIDEAISHYSEAVKILPENGVFHHALAIALISNGKQEEAIHHLNEALRMSPDSPEVLTNLGSALRRQGKFEESVRRLSQALAIKPLAETRHNLGLLYAERGEYREAILHYREALHIKPGDARIHNDLSIALHLQGDGRQALFHLSEAIRLDPGNAMFRHNFDSIREQGKGSSTKDAREPEDPGYN